MNNKKMVQQYLVTALWAEIGRNEEPLDKDYSVEDVSPESVARAEKDCAQFYEKAQAALKAEGFDIVELDEELLGHDFWLTRNGHGAGFWDGDYEKRVGEILTKISKEFGEIYATDDRGQVFLESHEAGLSVMVDGKVYGLASRVMAEDLAKDPRKPIEREATIEITLKEAAEALGYLSGRNAWSIQNDYLDADYDIFIDNLLSDEDVQSISVEGMDDVEKIFPSAVSMAFNSAQNAAYAADLTKARHQAIEAAMEKIDVVAEYMTADHEMISVPSGASIKSCVVDAPADKVTLVIKNPEHLINDLMNGDGGFYPEFDPYEAASDSEIKKYLHYLGKFFDIYGESKPEAELDSRYSPDVDQDYLVDELKFRISEMTLEDIADAVIDAVDEGRLEDENEAVALAAKFSDTPKAEIAKAVKAKLAEKGSKLSARQDSVEESAETQAQVMAEAKKKSLEDRADELLSLFGKKVSIEKTIGDESHEIEIGDLVFEYGGRQVSVSDGGTIYIWDVNSFGDRHSYMLFDIQDGYGETIEESVVQDQSSEKKKFLTTLNIFLNKELHGEFNLKPVEEGFLLEIGDIQADQKSVDKFLEDLTDFFYDLKKSKAYRSIAPNWEEADGKILIFTDPSFDESGFYTESTVKGLDEAASGDAPQVYVGTYGKYNSGSIEGKWLNLEDYKSLEEFLEAAKELHKDESDPELMFQDSMNFPEQYYGESYIKPELWDWIALDDREKAIVSAYFEKVGGSKEISEILESCMGQYDNRTDWVFDWIDEGLIQPSESQVYVDDVTARTIGIEDADNYVSDLSESDAVSEAGLEDEYEAAEEKESLQAQLEELESEEEPDQAKIAEIVSQLEKMAAVGKPDEIVAKAREQIATERADSIEEAIKRDAFDYFVNEIGAYTAEDFMKQSFVSVDYQRIARDLELSGITVAEVNGDIYVFND